MKAERRVWAAAGGILLFFGAAMFLTWRATEAPPAIATGGDPVVVAVPTSPPPAPPARPAAAPESTPPGQATPVLHAAGPRVAAAPASTPWPDVPAVAHVTALGALGGPLHAGLEATRDRMEYCFQEEMRRLDGAPPRRPLPEDPPGGPASLTLRLETHAGAIEIVDTEIDYLATSSPELVECCRRALRAVEIPAAGASPGQRYRIKYLLQ